MKQIIKIYSRLICLLLLAGNISAQNTDQVIRSGKTVKTTPTSARAAAMARAHAQVNGGVRKEKSFTKTYPLHNRQAVEINNQYGNVTINSWKRKEVKVDAVITVHARNDQAANDLLSKINIESHEGNAVSFKTVISGNSSNGKSHTAMEIKYEVYMPAENPLSVKNRFGSTVIPDWSGDIHINQSYGDIATGVVANARDLKVSFGSLASKAINNGNVNVSYSNVTIEKLNGNVNARIDFCGQSKITLQKDLEKLDLKSSYSDVTLLIPASLSALLNINTSYGDLRNKSGISIVNKTKEKKYGPTFNKVFSGKSGSGKSEINISSSFGNIILQ